MGKNPRSIVGNERGATAYKTRNTPQFRDAIKLHDVDESGKVKPTIHIKRNKAGETRRTFAPLLLLPPPFFSLLPAGVPKKGGGRCVGKISC